MRNNLRSCSLSFCALIVVVFLTGANYRTQNFLVSAPSASVAKRIALSAEDYRRILAIEWLGAELPEWSQPCAIHIADTPLGPTTGRTSFAFRDGQPSDWEMNLAGPAGAVVAYVLPHEVMHTVLATHFGRPLPRWAEEGTCTVVEHPEEVDRHRRYVAKLLRGEQVVSLTRLFATEDYPRDPVPFYMQSFSVASYLIERGGRRKFIDFLDEASRSRDWSAAVRAHYGLDDLVALETAWLRSVAGRRYPTDAADIAISQFR